MPQRHTCRYADASFAIFIPLCYYAVIMLLWCQEIYCCRRYYRCWLLVLRYGASFRAFMIIAGDMICLRWCALRYYAYIIFHACYIVADIFFRQYYALMARYALATLHFSYAICLSPFSCWCHYLRCFSVASDTHDVYATPPEIYAATLRGYYWCSAIFSHYCRRCLFYAMQLLSLLLLIFADAAAYYCCRTISLSCCARRRRHCVIDYAMLPDIDYIWYWCCHTLRYALHYERLVRVVDGMARWLIYAYYSLRYWWYACRWWR